MKANKILSALSASVIAGFAVGLVNSVFHILANRYIPHRLLRLAALTLEAYLTKWLISFIIICIGAVTISSLLLFLIRHLDKLFLNTIKISVKDKDALRRFFSAGIICFAFFFYSGWVANLYWLPYNKFHPISLLVDIALLILAVLLGWGLTKIRLQTLSRYVKIHRAAIAVILFLTVFKLCIFIDGKINAPEGPNVILLIVDAWRADSLGCYNKSSVNTPNIDEFAQEAVLFKNAISQSPGTINSAPSIFCSVYPYEHGYFNYRCFVSRKFNTLAEFLKNEGYRTFGVSTNPHVTKKNGLTQGFDVFVEDLVWKNTDCDEVNETLTKWLDNNNRIPFFAMLWYIDPHTPYQPPPGYINKYIPQKEERELILDKTTSPQPYIDVAPMEREVSKKLYAAEVNFFDTEFAKLIDYLEQHGLMRNSIIILTADHGESFWEKKDPLGKEVVGHGTYLCEEQLNIPLIIYLPSQQEGKVILEKAQHIDIVPTVLEYVGIDHRFVDNLPLRGDSLKGVINGEELERQYFFAQLVTDQYGPYCMECVQAGNFKLVSVRQYKDVRYTPSKFLLFDLSSHETEIDVLDESSALIPADLKRQLLHWEGSVERIKFPTGLVDHKYTDEENRLMERLKSLGYLR